MKYLITGGCGFLGSSLARRLIREGARPVLLDVAPLGPMLQDVRDRLDYVRGSQTNLSVVLNCLREHSVRGVFHLGGMLSAPSEQDPWSAFDVNVVGTYNVLEACRIAGVDQVVYGSTVAVYSRGIRADFIDDDTLQRPTSMYGTTKVFGELLGRFYRRKFGLDFRGVRIPSVVGPGAKTAHMSIYNAWAIEYPLRGKPYRLLCEPETRCPVIYFKDAARSLWELSQAPASRIETVVYNLAGITPAFSARELVEHVRKRLPGADLDFRPDPLIVELLRELGRLRIVDDAARDEWGWSARYGLAEMIEDFIQEFSKHAAWYA
jgi:threonine 3-dehydrogenase